MKFIAKMKAPDGREKYLTLWADDVNEAKRKADKIALSYKMAAIEVMSEPGRD